MPANVSKEWLESHITSNNPDSLKFKQLKKYRESHNEVERRRRENINQIIGELATLVPECHPGQSKGMILRRAAEYIRYIQQIIPKSEFPKQDFQIKREPEDESEFPSKRLKQNETDEEEAEAEVEVEESRSDELDLEEESEQHEASNKNKISFLLQDPQTQ